MKLADAKLGAQEDGEDWKTMPFLHKLDRIDSDEGHEIYSWDSKPALGDRRSEWQINVGRTWLHWGFGFEVQVEPSYDTAAGTVWLAAMFGPLAICITRKRWPE